MRVIALTGPAKSGKDTIAGILAVHGFVKFSFSDDLYKEVSEGYGVKERFLHNQRTKERPTLRLALWRCKDRGYVERMMRDAPRRRLARLWAIVKPRSPREVLQTWGTQYRREQDPDYWVKRAEAHYKRMLALPRAERPVGMVNTSLRFSNELAWLETIGASIWHVRRPGYGAINDHEAEQGIPFRSGHYVIKNFGTIGDLARACERLLRDFPEFRL